MTTVALAAVGPVVLPAPAHAGTGGRFTFLRDDGSLWGITLPGSGYEEIPFEIDTDGDGRQELAVYYAGRMTIRRDDGSLPFAIDTDGRNGQELAVYRNGRVTIRRDDGTYWGFDFQGAGIDELPMAVDTNGDGQQEFTMYDHRNRQLVAKQILANPGIDTVDHGNGAGRLVRQDLELTADGGTATAGINLSTTLLELIERLGQNHTLAINTLESGGTGHSSGSAHYIGTAVDFGKLDTSPPLTGRDPASLTIIDTLKYLMPPGPGSGSLRSLTGFGQSTCAGRAPSLPAGVVQFTDTCNHLHMQVKAGTP